MATVQTAMPETGSETLALARDDGTGSLARAWRALEAQAARCPTQTHAFVAALAGSLLAGSQVEVFMAADGAGIGALLPLCRDPGYFARWRVAGARQVFEPVDALTASPAAADRLASRLARQPRALVLDRLPADSMLLPALKAAMARRGLVLVRPDTPSPTIALDPGWAEPEAHFNAGRRSDFRRAARRAEEMGAVSYGIHAPTPEEFDALFDEAIAVELRSWKREAGTAIALDPAKQAFFRNLFRAASAEGTMRIAFLRIDGQPAAMQLAMVSQGRFWLFKIGFDEAYSRCSPGTLLMLHTIGQAAREGLVAYELLGGVEPWIAELWTRDSHACVRLRAYPWNLRGLGALAVDAMAWLGQRLRRSAG